MVKIKKEVTVHPGHTHKHTHTHTNALKLVKLFNKINLSLIFIDDILKIIQVFYYKLLVFNILCKCFSYSFLPYVINIRTIRSALRSRDCGKSAGSKIRDMNSGSGMIFFSLSIVPTDPAAVTAYPVHFRKTCLMPT